MTSRQAAPGPVDDSDRFVAQARWLLEWHNRRSDAIVNRAVTLLGFNGAILALLVNAAKLSGSHTTCAVKTLAVLTGALIFCSALFCLLTIVPRSVIMPSVEQLRTQWQRHTTERAAMGPTIAESFLNASDLGHPSPVDGAKDEASTRSRRFKVAAWLLLAEIGALAALALAVLKHW